MPNSPQSRLDLPGFLLLRKSRADEEEEKRARAEGRAYDALATHRAILCDLAARDRVSIDYVCAEVQSGERLAARPDFQRFLQHLRSLPRPGGILYVIHPERVSRGLLSERGVVQDLFVAQEILIRSPGGWTDLQSADERLLYEVKGALAHHYLLRYKERVALTRQLQVREGRVRNGMVPYGYEWDHKHKRPIPHPEEFPILKALCREALTRSTRELSLEYGLGQKLILRALKSPVICGWPAQTSAYRVTGSGTISTYYLPREQWVWPEQAGDYEAAISREEWERLQQALISRRSGRSGHGSVRENHWCRDVVRFRQDPGPCRLGTYSGYGGSYPTYVRPPRLYVARSVVHEAVETALERLFARGEQLARVIQQAASAGERDPDTGQRERRREELRRELVALERKAAVLEGERAIAIEAAIKEVERELEAVKRGLDTPIQAPRLSREEAAWLADLARHLGGEFRVWWGEYLSDVEKRKVARLLVAAAWVEAEKTVTVQMQDGLEG